MHRQRQLDVYRSCTPIADARYDHATNASPAEAVVTTIADAMGVDPTTLPPLYDVIDPDALNDLFSTRDSNTPSWGNLGFQYEDWNVFVHADGRIRVCDATRRTTPAPSSNPLRPDPHQPTSFVAVSISRI